MPLADKVGKALRVVEHFGPWQGLRLGWSVLTGRPKVLVVRDPSGITYRTRNDRSQASHLAVSTSKILAMVARLERCDSLLDLGGNVGLFSLAVRHRFPGADIVCIEADPNNAVVAQMNLGARGSRVIARAVVEDHRAEVPLFVAREGNQIGSLSRDSLTPFAPAAEISQIQVPAINVREAFALLGDVDVLKLDIQGYEHRLLAPHADLLDRVRVCFVEVSFLDPDAHRLLELMHRAFPRSEAINPVSFGADLMFWR